MKQSQILKQIMEGVGLKPGEADKVIGQYHTPMKVVLAGPEAIFDASGSNVACVGRLVLEAVLKAFPNLTTYSPDSEYVGPHSTQPASGQPDLAGAVGTLIDLQTQSLKAQLDANRPTVYELTMNQTLNGLSRTDGNGYDRKELVKQAQRLLVGFTGRIDDRVVAYQEQDGIKLVIVTTTQRAISDLHVARDRNVRAELPVEYAGHRLITFEALLPKQPGVITYFSPVDASAQLFGDNLAEGRLEWRVSSDSEVQNKSFAFAIWALHLDTHGLWQGMKGAQATRLLPYVFAKTNEAPEHLADQVAEARKAIVDFNEAMQNSTIRRRIEQHLFEGISAAMTGGTPSPFVGSDEPERTNLPKPPPVRIRSLVHPKIRALLTELFGTDKSDLRMAVYESELDILGRVNYDVTPENYLTNVLTTAEQAGELHRLYDAIRHRYPGNLRLGSFMDYYCPQYRWLHYLRPKMTAGQQDGRQGQLRRELLESFAYQTIVQAAAEAGVNMERVKTDEPAETGTFKLLEEIVRNGHMERFLATLILQVD